MSASTTFISDRGKPYPAGLSRFSMRNLQWHNFSIFAPASHARLEIYNESGQIALLLFDLDPKFNRTGQLWHVAIAELPPQFSYTWRFGEPLSHPICDPRAELLAAEHVWGQGKSPGSKLPVESLTLASPCDEFDWRGDQPLKLAWDQLILYEVHVRGFTQHISSQCKSRGTFRALTSKLLHLKQLGITAIELMPICEFAEGEYQRLNPQSNVCLCNYWGYSTRHFFTPMRAYADPAFSIQARLELKELVRTAHSMNIEIILDVVYNHTGEGNELGSTISFKGLSEKIYYLKDQRGDFINHSGCGNTFNANHPAVAELIIDSMRHWVCEYHIDGFRFDLATILMRTPENGVDERSLILSAIVNDPLLSKVKLIAEPWDPSGVYRVGNFPFGDRFCEWNGRFRDDTRRFLNFGKNKGSFASRLCGSQDLYEKRAPHSSINFITCHDGFTLFDLVSFDQKHNEENGEDNRDGFSDNLSRNFGVEGSTEDLLINSLRQRQMKNFLLALMISQGIPLLSSGDEYGHTRGGNNNGWCQDNEKSWFRWDFMIGSSLPHFTRLLIALRRNYLPLKGNFLSRETVLWHGQKVDQPHWDQEDGLIALTLKSDRGDLYIAFNASPLDIIFDIPAPCEGKVWSLVLMTSEPFPSDIFTFGAEPIFLESLIEIKAHSSTVLVQKDKENYRASDELDGNGIVIAPSLGGQKEHLPLELH